MVEGGRMVQSSFNFLGEGLVIVETVRIRSRDSRDYAMNPKARFE